MPKAMLTLVALAAAVAIDLAGAGPAAAADYPWCAQGIGIGTPGECSFFTFRQCMESASGRGLTCNVNPRVASIEPPRRPRPYRDYRSY